MKNISTLILLTASSLALVGCCGNNRNSNPEDAAAILTGQSIADGSIRPEVRALTKESMQKVMSERDETKQQEIAQEVLAQYQSLLKTSTNQQERDLLQMYVNSSGKTVELNKITDESARKKAQEQALGEKLPESRSFLQKYIQSTQLKSLMVGLLSVEIERGELNKQESSGLGWDFDVLEKKTKASELEKKKTETIKQILALYDNPNLDAQTKAELAALDEIGMLPKSMIESARKTQAKLCSGYPNLSEKVSLRRARQDGSSVDLSQLMVNGIAGSQAQLGLPVYVQLKGAVDGSKDTKDLTGVAVYKLNNTLVGIIHGYANASNDTVSSLSHHESSVVVSQSFGKAYIEGQAGFVKSIINQLDVNGGRYQLAAGYDFDAVTPFVQATFRNLNNVAEHAAYAGCELDVVNIVTDSYALSGRLTVKGGYHSFKGMVGSIEGSGAIQLNDGLKIDAAVNLAEGEVSTARIGFSVEQ